MCGMTCWYVWHDSFIRVTWLLCMCDMTRVYCVTWLDHTWDMTHWYVCHAWLICAAWLVDTRDMTPMHVSRDSFSLCDMTQSYMGRVDMCAITRRYVWYDSLVRVTWLLCTCDMTCLIYIVWRDSIMHVTRRYVRHNSLICVTWLVDTRDMTPMYVWHDMTHLYCATWLNHTWEASICVP